MINIGSIAAIVGYITVAAIVVSTSVYMLRSEGGAPDNIIVAWSGVTGDSTCTLTFKDRTFNCSLGRNGVTSNKREGDGCTPRGTFPLREGYYRQDRIGEVEVPAFFNMTVTKQDFGWCDASSDPNYNKFVFLPYPASHENLWLNSSVYDLFAVIGYNDDPVVPGYGSAIFFHVTETYGSTAGCVAMKLDELRWVLSQITPDTQITIL